jgi:UDP-N-acetyl-D-mannosaminuronic acid dehydrogenase
LGLAFKANVDDLRESPAMEIVSRLIEEQLGQLYVVEPHIYDLPQNIQCQGVYKVDIEEAVRVADIILVLVAHNDFKTSMMTVPQAKVLIDVVGLFPA